MKRETITMPVLSDTMHSGHLSRWLKKPGDPIRKGDPIAEIESDKAVMEIEAFSDGYLAGPLAPEGADIPVGTTIAYITDSPDSSVVPDNSHVGDEHTNNHKESASSGTKSARQKKPSAAAKAANPVPPDHNTETATTMHHPQPSTDPSRIKISPYARGLAAVLGIQPEHVKPGEDGIIHSQQVISAVLGTPLPDLDAGPPWHYKLLTPMRRAIADNMTASAQTPTFRISSDIALKPLLEQAQQQKLSLSLLLARALALSVTSHPHFNAAYTPNGFAMRKQVDVGIAVDVPGGLVTPVLKDMADRPLEDLAEDWQKLKQKTQNQQLLPEDYQGATIYLSNLGMFDQVKSFEAIVPLGASAILAVGAIQDDDTACCTLSCDHRVVTGADAARFMQTFAGFLTGTGNSSLFEPQ